MEDILSVLNSKEKKMKFAPQTEYLIFEKSKLCPISIRISGYRHSSNLLMAAAIIVSDVPITLHNLPDLLDTHLMIDILKYLGAECSYHSSTLTLDTKKISSYKVPNYLSEQIHGSLYLIPALLARFKKVIFGKSGGCQIGDKEKGFARPIQHILDVMGKFGGKISCQNEVIKAEAEEILSPNLIDIQEYSYHKEKVIGPLTSGATKTAILMALAVKKGKTIILNPFLKSEAIDLLDFVKAIGYKVSYDNSRIEIEYFPSKNPVTYSVISDPSEIITYLAIAGYHKIILHLKNVTLKKTWSILKPELDILAKIGITCKIESDIVIVHFQQQLQAVDIEITPTGVCTDHHPFLVLLMLKASAISNLVEHVWHDRFNYVKEVNKYGVNLKQVENCVTINPAPLNSTNDIINCPDLRAAAMLAILALDAPGRSKLKNYHHLERGYVNFIHNLKKMGGSITNSSI